MLWVKSTCFSKIVFFQKNMVSLYLIRSVHFVFRPIKIFKIWNFLREWASVCFDRSRLIFDRSKLVFLVFKKGRIGLFQSHYSNFFKVPLSLRVGTWLLHQFLSFSFKILAGFLSLEAGKTFLPFFFKFISCFHAFFMHSHGYFQHLQNYWVFDYSSQFLCNWSMGFCAMMLYWCSL